MGVDFEVIFGEGAIAMAVARRRRVHDASIRHGSQAVLLTAGPASALNKFEENAYGLFDRGSSKQFGSMNINGQNVVKEAGTKELGLSNFTSTEMRNAVLDGANLKGTRPCLPASSSQSAAQPVSAA